MSNKYFSSYDNKTIMADVDVHGHSLELTIENGKVTAIGGSAVGGDDGTWETKGYGAIVTDETDDVITDEDGNGIADETQAILWASYNAISHTAHRHKGKGN